LTPVVLVDLGLETMLRPKILLRCMKHFLALIGGGWSPPLNILLDVMGDCWVVKLALHIVVLILAAVSLLSFGLRWRWIFSECLIVLTMARVRP
jgi:hypothetical protein